MVKILILDDEKQTLKMLRTLLDRDGKLNSYISDIQTFSDPLLAVDKYDKINPDLILLDYMMPNLSGFEFLEAIGWSPDGGPPVILFTAYYDSKGVQEEVNKLGINYVLPKPIRLEELSLKILAALGREQADD